MYTLSTGCLLMSVGSSKNWATPAKFGKGAVLRCISFCMLAALSSQPVIYMWGSVCSSEDNISDGVARNVSSCSYFAVAWGEISFAEKPKVRPQMHTNSNHVCVCFRDLHHQYNTWLHFVHLFLHFPFAYFLFQFKLIFERKWPKVKHNYE